MNLIPILEVLEDPCEDLLPIIKLVRYGIIPTIEFIIPIILIILGIVDLTKAVIASKEDEMKAASRIFIKRCIYAVCIFFVMLIVTVAFNLLGANNAKNEDITKTSTEWLACWERAEKK